MASKVEKGFQTFFFGIQEIQISNFCLTDLEFGLGNSDFDYDFMGATKSSNGLISIYDKNLFEKIICIKSRHFLAVAGYWQGTIGKTTFVNVYAPNLP